MKTIGILGGMSWESTLEYYKIINEKTKEKLGGDHSAELVMFSFDFNEIVTKQEEGEWDQLEDKMVRVSLGIKDAGADFLIICANTMHKVADGVEARTELPILHIAEAVGEKIEEQGLNKVGLIGTRYVMEMDFYKDILDDFFDIELIIPEEEGKQRVHDIVYKELCRGIQKEESKDELLDIIYNLVERGAEGVILGCTEIPLIINQMDIDIPTFDTMRLHAEAAVEYALEGD
ncbi:MAG: aspartate/glutamate racemase family protein [Thermoplasmata archaeon]